MLWKMHGTETRMVCSGEETCHLLLSILMGEQATRVTIPGFSVHTAWQKEEILKSSFYNLFCLAEPPLYYLEGICQSMQF